MVRACGSSCGTCVRPGHQEANGPLSLTPGDTAWWQVGSFYLRRFPISIVSAATAAGAKAPNAKAAAIQTQHRATVEGTLTLATAAIDAGVDRLVHVSTTAVYSLTPDRGDVDETAPYVDDDSSPYAVTKRDADLALADLAGITRILARPPAILGPGDTSIWNTLRPARIAQDPSALQPNPDATFAWVHVTDLATFLADTATNGLAPGPAQGEVTAVNVAADGATWGTYLGRVATALGIAPTWSDEPAWRGQVLSGRARSWGWSPDTTFDDAMAELVSGLTAADSSPG